MTLDLTRRAFTASAGGIVLAFALDLGTSARAETTLPGTLGAAPRLDAWIRLAADGNATVFTGRVENGDGLLTAFAQIVADELDLGPARVRIVAADTATTPDEGPPTGSDGVETTGTALRFAAAEMRAILIGVAAARLGVPADQLSTRDGVVTAKDGRVLGYGDLAGESELHRAATGTVSPKAVSALTVVGTSLPRRDLPPKAMGERVFVHDLARPGMLHGRVVRSPRIGAVLEKVDPDVLGDLPGLVAVVRDGSFLGVITEREEHAVKARAALLANATWSGGAAVPDPARVFDQLLAAPTDATVVSAVPGDTSPVALPAGATLHEAVYRKPYLAPAPLGPSAALALYADGHMTVWTASSDVHGLRGALATALAMPLGDIRCIYAEGGGGFGHSGADDVALDAALLARAVPDRPVRVQWTREDEFALAPCSPAMVVTIKAALAKGRIVDWDYQVWSPTHAARPRQRGGVNLLAAAQLEDPKPPAPARPVQRPDGGGERNAVPLYNLPRHRVVSHFVRDLPVRVSTLRSRGAFTNVMAIESFMDELALAAGTDPLAFRLAHLSDPRARGVLEAAAKKAGWKAGQKAGGGSGRGLGFARYKNRSAYLAAIADVEVDRKSGLVRVRRVTAAVDAGLAVNPADLIATTEGGILQSVSWTLREAVRLDATGIADRSFADYPILGFSEAPAVEVLLVGAREEPSLGAAEAALGPTAAAVMNAVASATGKRVRDLPLTPPRVLAALAGTDNRSPKEKRR